jgi:hypothetical protein
MSRPARRRRWPSISRDARTLKCPAATPTRRMLVGSGSLCKGMLWWADGGVGHTSAPGPAGRRPGAVSVIERSFGCQLFDAFNRWQVPIQFCWQEGRLGAIMRCWNGPGSAWALLTTTRAPVARCPGQVEPGEWAAAKYADAHAPQRITTNSRIAARWAGTHADLKAVNESLSDCFKDMRRQERSEWAAANPLPQDLSAGASKVEQMTVEHLLMVREIRRLTKNDRFTGSCCLEIANRPMEVMHDLEEVLPSVTNDRIKYVHLRRKYLRDDIWMSASVDSESQRVGIFVEGTDPRWVKTTANQLENSLRTRSPRWAPLASRWGFWLSQLAFGLLVAAIVWRVTDGPGVAPPWWALAGAVLISFLATGNLPFLNWLLPKVDIYSPGSQPTGTTHLKWADAAIAAAVMGVIFDILLRG